jgi:hypothetical protein
MVLKNARLLHHQRPVLIELDPPQSAIQLPMVDSDKIWINLVQKEDELLPLPSIGKGRAKTLLAVRPEAGFADMAELKALSKFDFTDEQWNQVEAGLAFSQE